MFTTRIGLPSRSPRLARPVAVVAIIGALGACTTATAGQSTAPAASAAGAGATGATPTPTTAPVSIDSNIAAGASGIAVDTVVSVTANGGSLVSVELTYQDPKAGRMAVTGSTSADNAKWTADSLLEPATDYTLQIVGENIDGDKVTVTRAFRTHTLAKNQEAVASIVQDGATVGIAMPVIVRFNTPISDKAAIERKLSVTSVPSQPGGWAWYGNNEVHFRPKVYWQPGTKVTVKADINGVPAGNGVYGKDNKTGGFTVGSATVLKADYSTHQMQVYQDGKLTRTIPLTGGRPGDATRSGIKVISEKYSSIIMDGASVGIPKSSPDYYRLDVKFAMRITNSGEFIHSAPWSVGSQGRANVSHGCTNIGPGNAQWLFGIAKVGDPVEAVNSGRSLERGNGWTDWNASFEDFIKSSALAGAAPAPAPTATSNPSPSTTR